MIVAPELFTPSRALESLHIADKALRGPLGMKTLDPSDSQYRPNYDNANDGTDQAVAKGWNVSLACSGGVLRRSGMERS
jgi:glycogen debranching enzyme